MTYTLEQLPNVWVMFSQQLCEYISTDCDELQAALKDTYEVLQKYKDEKNIPREVSDIIYHMKAYSIYIEEADDLPIIDYSSAIATIISNVIDGFLENNYEADFPVLKISKYLEKPLVFDMEKDDLFDVLNKMRKASKHILTGESSIDTLYIEKVADKWDSKTDKIFKKEEVTVSEIEQLFKESYIILSFHRYSDDVPKSVCKLLFNMYEFLDFMGIISENENMNCKKYYQLFHNVFTAMKNNFFNEPLLSVYPELILDYPNSNSVKFNFETDNLEDLIK